MPGIGFQHLRAQLARDLQHVAEQPFLAGQGQDGDPQRGDVDFLQRGGVLQAHRRAPEQGAADAEQNQPERQGGGGFDAGMAVGMLFVRIARAMAVGEQHQKIAQQVGQGMQAVGDQRLGFAEQADHDLQHGQHHVHRDADPGHFLRGLKAPDPVRVDFSVRFGRVVGHREYSGLRSNGFGTL